MTPRNAPRSSITASADTLISVMRMKASIAVVLECTQSDAGKIWFALRYGWYYFIPCGIEVQVLLYQGYYHEVPYSDGQQRL